MTQFTFQILMHTILVELMRRGVLLYLNNIIIYAKIQSDHDFIHREVFNRAARPKLKINSDKCTKATEGLQFLGFEVTANDVICDENSSGDSSKSTQKLQNH